MFFQKNPDANKSFILNYAPIFSSLSTAEKSLIDKKSDIVPFAKGTEIYKQGDPPDAFYCVISGRIKISQHHPHHHHEDILDYLTCGMYFGIISLLTTDAHSVNAQAVNDAVLLRIKKEDFDFLLIKIPTLAVHLSKTLSTQIRGREEFRQAAHSSIISVGSACGGIGRSMYAINLALSLAKETHKKVIFLNMSRGDNALMQALGIGDIQKATATPSPLMHTDAVRRRIVSVRDAGIAFLNIVHDIAAGASLESVSSLLSLLAHDYRYVVIDLPLEIDETILKAFSQSDSIHIVTDFEIENLKSTRALMVDLFKRIEFPQEKIKVILNEHKEAEKITYEEVVTLLEHPVFAKLPVFWQKADVINEVSATIILTQPGCDYAKAIRRIAREIGDVLVGLALGGGAAFGLAHTGVLKIIERENIPIDMVAGSSMGALVGALWASGKSAADIEKIFMEYNNKKRKVFETLVDVCLPPKISLIEGRRIDNFLKHHLGDATFADCRIPLKIISCNLDTREKVVFESGPLVDAIMSSIAIPGIFQPVQYGKALFVDGSILEPVPTPTLARFGVKHIIAVNVLQSPHDIQEAYKLEQFSQEQKKVQIRHRPIGEKFLFQVGEKAREMLFPNIFDILVNSMLTMQYVISQENCKAAHVVINPIVHGTAWFEFFKVDELIKKGEQETERALIQIQELISH